MTLPPSLVAAVREAVCPCFGNRALMDADAEAIALAVLRAALTGEGLGPWRTVAVGEVGQVLHPDASEGALTFTGPGAPAMARAVAAALNLLPALEAP